MRETTVESYLRDKVKEAGGLCIKLSPAFFKGIPDQLVLLPGGRVFFVELKAPGKKAKGLQPVIHRRLRSLGFSVEVLDTSEKVLLFVAKHERFEI